MLKHPRKLVPIESHLCKNLKLFILECWKYVKLVDVELKNYMNVSNVTWTLFSQVKNLIN
jgi:hypothetical protein